MTTVTKPAETGSPDPIGPDDILTLRRRLLVPTLVLVALIVDALGAITGDGPKR